MARIAGIDRARAAAIALGLTTIAIAIGGASLWLRSRQRPALPIPDEAPTAPTRPSETADTPPPEAASAARPSPTPIVERERDFGGAARFGRLVGPDAAPVAGARIGAPQPLPLPEGSGNAVLLHELDPITRSDADGAFAVDSRSQSALLAVAAPGFGSVLIERSWLGEKSDAPLVIALGRAASLQAIVEDERGGGLRDVEVRVCTLGWLTAGLRIAPGEEFLELAAIARATTNGRGEATIGGLPAGVPFQIQLWRNGAARLVDRAEITPEPGETLERRWTLPKGATVRGRVVDEDEQPVPDLELKVVDVLVVGEAHGTPVPSSGGATRPPLRCDRDGSFTIGDLAPGRYVVGAGLTASTLERDGVLASLTHFDVGLTGEDVEIVLVVRRGHSIRGKVVAPDGKPARAEVRVKGGETGELPFMTRATDAEGRFVVGPFESGTWELFAASLDPRFAASDSHLAEPDTDDLVLALRPGGEIRPGAIRGRDGEPVAARFALFGGPSLWQDGAFRSVAPGRYDLVATTADGSIGFERGLDVSEGEKVEGVRVRVDPGATLVVTSRAPVATPIELFAGDFRFAAGQLEPGATREFVVPTANLHVTGLDGSTPVKRDLDLKPGERRALAWPPASGEDRHP